MKQAHLLISGRVHGVSFRFNVKWRARKLGLVGYVRNLRDGKVEVLAEGSEEKLSALVEYCKKGPIFARVDEIKVEYKKPSGGFKDFNILH